MLFGLGAVFGPSLAGTLGDRIGLGRAYVAVFAVKAIAVLLPWRFSAVPVLALSSLVVGALTPAIPALFSARVAELVPPRDQSRIWGWATLSFAVAQAGGAYGLSFAYEQIGVYRPLYLVGALIEAAGARSARCWRCRCALPLAWLREGLDYFPMQKSRKMMSSRSSTSTRPVTRPSARAARRTSSAASSGSAAAS